MAKFVKGKSGNAAGKPKGSKDRRTELRELLKPHAENLIQKAVNMALSGDPQALRLCLDRIIPPVRATGEPLGVKLPTTGTLAEQGAAIYHAAANGEITLEQATAAMQTLAGQIKIIELTELEQRISRLEQQGGEQ